MAFHGIPPAHQENDLDQDLDEILAELDAFLDQVDDGEFARLFDLRFLPDNPLTYQIFPDTPPPSPNLYSLSDDEWAPSYSPSLPSEEEETDSDPEPPQSFADDQERATRAEPQPELEDKPPAKRRAT